MGPSEPRQWDVRVASVADLAEIIASDFEAEGTSALARTGRFSVALPGGSVATSFFPRLARVGFDWSRTHFFWVDERAVPPADPESNYGAAWSSWLAPARVPAGCIHRLRADDPDGRASSEAYARELQRLAGVPPRLDYVILGVGPDGHVASLFPGHPLLAEERRLVAEVEDAPKPPPRRLTLTLPVLRGAGRMAVAAFGRAKAAALRDALGPQASSLPLARAIRGPARVMVLLDPEAASLIRTPQMS